MTVTVEIPSSLSARFAAHARAENKDPAQLAQALFTATLYDEDEAVLPSLSPSLTEPLAESLGRASEGIAAGRVVDGDLFLAELRCLSGR